jgi:hypothetical protein
VPPDSAAPAEPLPVIAPPSWTGEWAPAFGTMLLVPSDTDNTAIVVYPDAHAGIGDSIRLSLFTVGGEVAVPNVIVRGADSLECGGAPVVHLSGGAFGAWAIGVTATSRLLRSDSLESLAPRDSAQLVATLARLASTITAREETRFNALPFSVLRARRFAAGGTRVVAAHLVRKLPQEASPLEEHTFLIAERPLSSDSLLLRFHQRSEGTEETADHFEILAAAAAEAVTLLLVARDNSSGTQYQILERSPTGSWRVRWTRPLGC